MHICGKSKFYHTSSCLNATKIYTWISHTGRSHNNSLRHKDKRKSEASRRGAGLEYHLTFKKKIKGSSVDHMDSTERLLTGPHSDVREHYCTQGINAEVTIFISSKMVINWRFWIWLDSPNKLQHSKQPIRITEIIHNRDSSPKKFNSVINDPSFQTHTVVHEYRVRQIFFQYLNQ